MTTLYFAEVSRAALIWVFLLGGFTKLRGFRHFSDSLAEQLHIPRFVARGSTICLILSEVCIATLFFFDAYVHLATTLAGSLLLLFTCWLAFHLIRNNAISCGCFGETNELISPLDLVRNLLLFALTAVTFMYSQAHIILSMTELICVSLVSLMIVIVMLHLRELELVSRNPKVS